MPVEVRVPTVLRTYTRGAKQVDASGSTLREVIEHLESDHPGIKDRLIDDGDLRRFVNVYINDEDVRFMSGLDTAVRDGDVVVMLPAVAGGG
jgi:molybdopterin synthase sulfur carrier subunit